MSFYISTVNVRKYEEYEEHEVYEFMTKTKFLSVHVRDTFDERKCGQCIRIRYTCWKKVKKDDGKQQPAGSIGVEIIWIYESFIKREITWMKLVLRVG